MTDFRPICDFWILARSKVKYYGAYPAGFMERARALLGVNINDTVLHVCSGQVRQYPFKGLGRYDLTLDADPLQFPDILHDAQVGPYPVFVENTGAPGGCPRPPQACLCDPPYSEEDALKYAHKAYPVPSRILKAAGLSVPIGGRVGFLHYSVPRPPKWMRPVAYVSVMVGYENKLRAYSVFERME